VLLIAHDVERSGAPRVTVRLAAAFAAAGRPVRVCFPATGGCEADARAAGLETVVVPNPAVAMAGAGWGARAGLALARLRALAGHWREARRPGVGVVWAGSSMAWIGGLGGWLAGKPVVLHVHEDLAPTRGNRMRAWLWRRIASRIVFVARRTTRPFAPRRQPWDLLPNWVEPPADPSPAKPRLMVRADLGTTRGALVFLFVGFLSHRKGVDVLLEAFGRARRTVPGCELWLAGSAPDSEREYARQLRRLVAARGMGEAVRFLGHRDDVAALLQAADVFVLASRNEALPLSIIEAMAAARPVVATRVGSVEDLVRDGREGLVVPAGDAAALAAAMERLAGDGALRRRMGAAGASRAARRFSREALVGKALRILDNVK
jgi:glycosyltransferase involved in cell wall biosynthesis